MKVKVGRTSTSARGLQAPPSVAYGLRALERPRGAGAPPHHSEARA
jgi:hypothetical protein